MTSTDFKARRLALWPSQAKAAAALGVSRTAVTHWESGRHPVPESAVKLLECIEAQRLEPDEVHWQGRPE